MSVTSGKLGDSWGRRLAIGDLRVQPVNGKRDRSFTIVWPAGRVHEQAIERLTTENAALRQRIHDLTAQQRALDERLQAVRSSNRFLDKRIASLEAKLMAAQPGT